MEPFGSMSTHSSVHAKLVLPLPKKRVCEYLVTSNCFGGAREILRYNVENPKEESQRKEYEEMICSSLLDALDLFTAVVSGSRARQQKQPAQRNSSIAGESDIKVYWAVHRKLDRCCILLT